MAVASSAIPTLRHLPSSTKMANSESSESTRQVFKTEMRKARRQGHWFRLSVTERAFFSLATTLRIKYRSFALMKGLVAILKRLKEYGDSAYRQVLKGRMLAWSFSEAAVQWGNTQARCWRNEEGYIVFLGRVLASGFRAHYN